MEFARGSTAIVPRARFVKSWLEDKGPPSVDAARPAFCPQCSGAARIPGRNLRILGHGCRARQQRGPREPDRAAEIVVIDVRRFRCECSAVITVLPAGVAPRKHFSAPAIGLALALFGVLVLSPEEVRRRISPWSVVGAAARGWRSLFRWIDSAREGALFEAVRRSPDSFTRRQIAERGAAALAALAPPLTTDAVPIRAFWGAARMA